jgi:hypothetical protein
MSDKLSVHLWEMSVTAEGWVAIGATIVIVLIVAVVVGAGALRGPSRQH